MCRHIEEKIASGVLEDYCPRIFKLDLGLRSIQVVVAAFRQNLSG